MKALTGLILSLVLPAGSIASDHKYNSVQIMTAVTHADINMVQYRVSKPINGSSCRNDTRYDRLGIERGLAAVWLGEQCRDCDLTPYKMEMNLMHKKVVVDLLNDALSSGSIVRLVTKGCTPGGRAKIVDVVAYDGN